MQFYLCRVHLPVQSAFTCAECDLPVQSAFTCAECNLPVQSATFPESFGGEEAGDGSWGLVVSLGLCPCVNRRCSD